MKISFTVDVSRVKGKLNALKATLPDVIDEAMQAEMEEIRLDYARKPYPPERQGQKYKRTYRMKASWTKRRLKKTRGLVSWAIENKAQAPRGGSSYPSYVLGDDEGKQAWMHRRRWWVAVQYFEGMQGRIARAVKLALVRAARELDL